MHAFIPAMLMVLISGADSADRADSKPGMNQKGIVNPGYSANGESGSKC